MTEGRQVDVVVPVVAGIVDVAVSAARRESESEVMARTCCVAVDVIIAS